MKLPRQSGNGWYRFKLSGQWKSPNLDCVVQGVRYYAITDTPVSKDQFGKNVLYSD